MSDASDFPSLYMTLEARLNAVEREQACDTRNPTLAEFAELKSELAQAAIQIHKLSEVLKASNVEIARLNASSGNVSESILKGIAEAIDDHLYEVQSEVKADIQADYDSKIDNVRNLIGDVVEKSERASRSGATAISESLIGYAEDFAYGSVN